MLPCMGHTRIRASSLAGEGRPELTGNSLLQEMQQLQERKRRGAICSVSQVLLALSKQEQEAFNLACADQGIDGVTISTWLQQRGHLLRSWTINRHRRSLCSCAQ
jgi:hypothetical protein